MGIQISPKTALIVIDVQHAFKMKPYSERQVFPPFELITENIQATISAFRAASLPVIHIYHSSLETGEDAVFNPTIHPEGINPLPSALPLDGEPIFIKHVNSAFIGTGLEAHLREQKIDKLVIVGLTTSHCVSTTTRMAGNLGWDVYLPRDATGMFERAAAPGSGIVGKRFDAETMHEVSLAELHEEFAKIVTTEEILSALKAVSG
ncbi:isochorismatase family protein [Mycena amicta]|nr:isochorismatase family protein [Mycena amicta]